MDWTEAAEPWRVDWASVTDIDPRMRLKLHVESANTADLAAVAWGVLGERPMVAVSTLEYGEYGNGHGNRLRLWDMLSGRSRELPCAEPARCLSFAGTDGDPVLVSGHDGGWLRIWDANDLTLKKTVDAGYEVADLHVAEFGHRCRPLVATRDVQGRVRRWSLPDGGPLGALDVPQAYSMCGGRLADGRQVLLTGGEGVSLWDLSSGTRLPVRVPQGLGTVGNVALCTVSGRDCVTVYDEFRSIITFDPATGVEVADRITAHVNGRPDGLMQMWRKPRPRTKLAVVTRVRDLPHALAPAQVNAKSHGQTLAVPTPWRVHLWDLSTAEQVNLPLAGPVARASVQTVSWQGRELLLTASGYDGVVALWDLDHPIDRAPGHDQHVIQITVTDTNPNQAASARDEVVVSADEGGTLVARHAANGGLVAAPLATGIECTRSLTAWADGDDVIAATGAGSIYVSDGDLRRWNLTVGARYGSPIRAESASMRWLSWIRLDDEPVLVSLGPSNRVKLWRPGDGAPIAKMPNRLASAATGFAISVIGGRPFAVLSTTHGPLGLYPLDDLAAAPTMVPAVGNDVVLDAAGPHIVASHADHKRAEAHTIRSWHVAGTKLGPEIRSMAEITTAAVRSWPAVYIGRADGTVSLTDVETGRDLCAPLSLPSRPKALAVTGNGDLVVGFGSDVARVGPPVD